MSCPRPRKQIRVLGFTLVELMIVVAILGVLAAIAVPVFQRYLVTAKATEAPLMLRKVMDGANAYFQVEHADSNGQALVAQFPATTGWYPTELPIGRKVAIGPGDPPAADLQTWSQLKFTLTEPVQFHYMFVANGVGTSSSAYVAAEGQVQPGHTCRMERSAVTLGGSSLELRFSELKIISPPY